MGYTTSNFGLFIYSTTGVVNDLNSTFDLVRAISNNFTSIDANAVPRFTTTAVTMTGSYSTSGFIRAASFSTTGAIIGGSFTASGLNYAINFKTPGVYAYQGSAQNTASSGIISIDTTAGGVQYLQIPAGVALATVNLTGFTTYMDFSLIIENLTTIRRSLAFQIAGSAANIVYSGTTTQVTTAATGQFIRVNVASFNAGGTNKYLVTQTIQT
jgi:hypothetical protein